MAGRKDGFQGERSAIMPPFVRERMETDPFLSTLYITDIGYYPHAEKHHVERKTPLRQYVLIYCMAGKGEYSIGTDVSHRTISENQYVILPAGEAHEYSADMEKPWSIYWIHFGGTLAQYYAQDAGIAQSVRPSDESRISGRITLFEEILAVMRSEVSDDNLHYASSLLHHFLASLRYLHTYREAGDRQDTSDITKATCHYIDENIERHITLRQMADYVGLSVSRFSTVFSTATGCSPIAYINRRRIERACNSLRSTDMQINQVSHKVGIDDALYFSRLFSNVMSMSPSQYRNLQKEKNHAEFA